MASINRHAGQVSAQISRHLPDWDSSFVTFCWQASDSPAHCKQTKTKIQQNHLQVCSFQPVVFATERMTCQSWWSLKRPCESLLWLHHTWKTHDHISLLYWVQRKGRWRSVSRHSVHFPHSLSPFTCSPLSLSPFATWWHEAAVSLCWRIH